MSFHDEMKTYLSEKFSWLLYPIEETANNFSVETAIYWFAYDYHGGQDSDLYSVLSCSKFSPSPLHKTIYDVDDEIAVMMYDALIERYENGL